MSDEPEDVDEAILETMKVAKQALTEFAIEQDWQLEVNAERCEECGQDHVDEGWVWYRQGAKFGVVYTDFECYTVLFDTNEDDEDADVYCYDCESVIEVDLLVSMFRQRFEL